MTTRQKPVVGQKLFSLNIGNAAMHKPKVLTPVVVSSVGRKYFTVQTDDKYKFETTYSLETWREKTIYSADSCLYESEQEYADEKERDNIASMLRQEFGSYGRCRIGLKTLRAIKAALDAEKETTCKDN